MKLLQAALAILVHNLYSRAEPQYFLAQNALSDILERGAPILGHDTGCSHDSKTCDWMAKIPDDTRLVHMNLPGTHDAATWNYSQTTQDSLIRYTGEISPAETFRCQELSFFDMLNGGIRVFDLRFAWNPGNDTVGFYHSAALLSPTTRLEDVLFGLYSWLDTHPTETVLLSMNHEGGTGTQDSPELQKHIYDIFESPLARQYWLQTNGKLGTLGESRGKLILLQRFAYSLLPPDLTDRIGIALPPNLWTDNSANIELVYNEKEGRIAFIEDFYEPHPPPTESPDNRADISIRYKFNATVAHLTRAGDRNNATTKDQLFISFASGENNDESVVPKIMALGNGTATPGVNQRLLEWLNGRKGERRGIVMLDFFNTVPGLVEAVIGL
ncbi:PLC-like phosphodiesterase [Marasmius fiardii PR-910]|nr:PLC-like phosphodiesterase [Marasmius fiardii PR-910]